MSRLFTSFRETIDSTGLTACLISFLCFVIVWVLGYTFGVLMIILGLGDRLRECFMDDNSDRDIEEMIARMNEEGPNN